MNLADIVTKQMDEAQFIYLRDALFSIGDFLRRHVDIGKKIAVIEGEVASEEVDDLLDMDDTLHLQQYIMNRCYIWNQLEK